MGTEGRSNTQDWRARAVSPTEAVATIRSGEHVYIGTACATPRELVDALEALDPPPAGVVLAHFLTERVVVGHARQFGAIGQRTPP